MSAAAQVQDLLAPLRIRQRRWAAGVPDDEPEPVVRAQPLVLRLERTAVPPLYAALSAAAAASLAVLADPRSAAGGDWHEQCVAWLSGRIRKVTRRARTSHWQAAERIPGVTVGRDGAQVRAFSPYPIEKTPKEIARLQVSGTELPGPEQGGDRGATLWFPEAVPMSAGKAMAQAGHAAMLLATYLPEDDLQRWLQAGLPVAIRVADPARWARITAGPSDPEQRWERCGTVLVRDAGFTEVEPGTVTAAAALIPGVEP